MDPEEIERGFVDAGWEVPGPTRYPIVANVGDLSKVAHEQLCPERRQRVRDCGRQTHAVPLGQGDHHTPAGSGIAR